MSSATPASGAIRAVLLEASTARRNAMLEALIRAGMQVDAVVAEDQSAFARALSARRCDLLLVGSGRGGFGELKALEQAKRQWPEVPVIVLAEPRGEEAAVEALQRGATDYVVFSKLERLGSAVARALRDREERAGRRRAGEALEFSARASAELATSLDFTTTVERVARLAVPFLGGFAAVDVLEDGRVRRRAECALDDFPAALSKALGTLAHLPGDAFWAGRPESFPRLSGTDLPTGDEPSPLVEKGLVSLLRLPLRVQGRSLGLLTVVATRPAGPPTLAGLHLAEDFAHRAALALDAARLHQELLRSDQRKDEFLAMLAHELRNPLASILAGLELVKARAEGPHLQRPLLTAERQSKHMARILDDLLDISRITRGKIELRRQACELNALVKEAVQSGMPRAESRGLAMTLKLWTEPLPVFADPDRIEQVLSNVISNAAKFTKPGGQLWVSTGLENAEAVVRIRDSGVGIHPEMLSRIFDLFVQGNPSLDRTEGGLGLGLTLVRKLTELHGGRVAVLSEGHEKGSEFIIRLPLTAGLRPQPRPPPFLPPREPPMRLRVLLVDDNEDLRESTSELLRMLDHEVVEAGDGDEAVRRIQTEVFDVALVNLGLPGLNGYGVAQALRQLEEGSGHRTALVALTGYGQPEHRRRTLQAGFDEHLTKPLDFAQLREVLARVARQSAPAEPSLSQEWSERL